MSFSAETKVNLASYCVKSNGLIIHELMHAMGKFSTHHSLSLSDTFLEN